MKINFLEQTVSSSPEEKRAPRGLVHFQTGHVRLAEKTTPRTA